MPIKKKTTRWISQAIAVLIVFSLFSNLTLPPISQAAEIERSAESPIQPFVLGGMASPSRIPETTLDANLGPESLPSSNQEETATPTREEFNPLAPSSTQLNDLPVPKKKSSPPLTPDVSNSPASRKTVFQRMTNAPLFRLFKKEIASSVNNARSTRILFDGSSKANGVPTNAETDIMGFLRPRLPGIQSLAKNTDDESGRHFLTDPAPPAGDNGEKVKLPKSLWSLFWASSILTAFGTYFYVLSQPFLVMGTLKKNKTMMGLLRNVQLSAMAIVNFLPVGLLVDKTNFKILFVSCVTGRAILMAAIPILFLAGHLSFTALTIVTILSATLQGIQGTVYGAATNAFVGTDVKLNKEASAIITKYSSLAGIVFPIVAGAIIGSLILHFGPAAYAIAYAFYSLSLLAAIPVYWFGIKDPRPNLEINTFAQLFKATLKLMGALAKKTITAPSQFIASLIKKMAQEPRLVGTSKTAAVLSSLKQAFLRFLERHEATQGMAYILKNKILKVWLASTSSDSFLSDAMPLVVFPIFIAQLLVPPAHLPAFLTAIFGTTGGVFGLIFAFESLGLFAASWLMQGKRGDRLIQKFGVKGFYRIAGIGSVFFWLLWLFPTILFPGAFWINLPIFLSVQFVIAFLHAPFGVAMAPVVRKEIPDNYLGRVASAFFIMDLLFSAAGGISMGVLLDFVSIKTAMAIAASGVTLMGIVDWLIPHWLPLDKTKSTAPTKEGPPLALGDLTHQRALPRGSGASRILRRVPGLRYA